MRGLPARQRPAEHSHRANKPWLFSMARVRLLRLQKLQQIGIHLVFMRGAQAMRRSRIHLQRGSLDDLGL
jgi:hypothetical protein